MSSPDPELIEVLYRALRSPVGISVATSNLELLRNRLYKARADLADPDLDAIFLAPDPDRPLTHLFVMKKRVKIEGETNAENE